MDLKEFEKKVNKVLKDVEDLTVNQFTYEIYVSNRDLWEKNQNKVKEIYGDLALDLKDIIKNDKTKVVEAGRIINKKLSVGAYSVFASALTDFLKENESKENIDILFSLIPDNSESRNLTFAKAFENCDDLEDKKREEITERLIDLVVEKGVSINSINKHCSWESDKFDLIEGMVKVREKNNNKAPSATAKVVSYKIIPQEQENENEKKSGNETGR